MPFWQSEIFKERVVYEERLTYRNENPNPNPSIVPVIGTGVGYITSQEVSTGRLGEEGYEIYGGESKPYSTPLDGLLDSTINRMSISIRVGEDGFILESP